jgi:glyoxylase-like metal-dependent hydrolase (beta-lactamase superfamily II)
MLLPVGLRADWPALGLNNSGEMEIPVICLLVEIGGYRIVLDGGNGVRAGRPAAANGKLPQELASIGIDPDAIDIAVATHVHTDHVNGWISIDADGRAALVFARARHVIPDPEWDFTQNPPSEFDPQNSVVTGAPSRQLVLNTVKEAGLLERAPINSEIVSGVRYLHAPGHTPGHSVVVIESEGERLIFMADAFHLTAQVDNPLLVSDITDYPRQLVPATRRRLIRLAVNTGALVAGTHFPFPGVGRIAATTSGGVSFVPMPATPPPTGPLR